MEERQEREILAPAKLNLYLNLAGQRPDGYHELRSLMVDLDLADRILLDETEAQRLDLDEGSVLRLESLGRPLSFSLDRDASLAAREPAFDLPPERWSIVRAIETYGAICDAWGIEPQLAFSRVHLRRSIPAGAGLGGASSDAAHLLRFLLEQHAAFQTAGSTGRDDDAVVEALRPWLVPLGADVSFSYVTGPRRASGLGEILEPVPSALCDYPVLLVKPGARCATAEAFARYDRALGEGRAFQVADESSFLQAYETGDLGAMDEISRNTFCDLLPETVAAEILAIECALRDAGAPFVQMTGSGPTLFAIFDSPAPRDEAWQALQAQDGMADSWFCRAKIL